MVGDRGRATGFEGFVNEGIPVKPVTSERYKKLTAFDRSGVGSYACRLAKCGVEFVDVHGYKIKNPDASTSGS
jgi:hypothetical protein